MYIGIDIGGTKTAIGLAERTPEGMCIRSNIRIPTRASAGAPAFFKRAVRGIRQLIEDNQIELQGIGIGCTGPVDSTNGIINNPYTLNNWEAFAIVDQFVQEFHVPVRIENDVNVILLGEIELSSLHQEEVALFMIGTGVGIACYHHKALHTTTSHYHPEMGHMVISDTGPLCYCGNRGCLESLISGGAWNFAAKEAGFRNFEGLYHHYQDNDTNATVIMENKLRQMAAGIWNILLVFKPSIIFLGGGLMQKYYDFFVQKMTSYIPSASDFSGNFHFMKTHEADISAIVGAALLVEEIPSL
jgi:glucokinase